MDDNSSYLDRVKVTLDAVDSAKTDQEKIAVVADHAERLLDSLSESAANLCDRHPPASLAHMKLAMVEVLESEDNAVSKLLAEHMVKNPDMLFSLCAFADIGLSFAGHCSAIRTRNESLEKN